MERRRCFCQDFKYNFSLTGCYIKGPILIQITKHAPELGIISYNLLIRLIFLSNSPFHRLSRTFGLIQCILQATSPIPTPPTAKMLFLVTISDRNIWSCLYHLRSSFIRILLEVFHKQASEFRHLVLEICLSCPRFCWV